MPKPIPSVYTGYFNLTSWSTKYQANEVTLSSSDQPKKLQSITLSRIIATGRTQLCPALQQATLNSRSLLAATVEHRENTNIIKIWDLPPKTWNRHFPLDPTPFQFTPKPKVIPLDNGQITACVIPQLYDMRNPQDSWIRSHHQHFNLMLEIDNRQKTLKTRGRIFHNVSIDCDTEHPKYQVAVKHLEDELNRLFEEICAHDKIGGYIPNSWRHILEYMQQLAHPTQAPRNLTTPDICQNYRTQREISS